MSERKGSAKWWLLGGLGLLVAVPASCCCGMTMLGALSPAPAPSPPPEAEPVAPPVEQPAVAVGEAPVAEAEQGPALPAVAEEASEEDGNETEPGLPGIGATRAHWEATHRRVPGFTPGAVFGPMVPSSEGDGVAPAYATVFGDDRILLYTVNMPRGTTFAMARARMLRELPPDAREVRTRRLPQCRMVRYRSPTMRRIFGSESHRGDVEVGYFSADPDRFDPRRVTMTTIGFYVSEDIDC